MNSLQHLRRTKQKLADLRAIMMELEMTNGHSEQYFRDQWERKKAVQSQIISQTSKDYLEHVAELIDLEEKLVAAQEQLEDLNRRRRRRRRQGVRNHAGLPNTLVLLEKAIDNVSDKLGDTQLIELTGRSDARAKPLIKIRVAKGNLLSAKAGIIEHQRRASHARGTNVQKKMNTLRNLKNTQLRKKHATYWRLANDFNNKFHPEALLPTPSLQEVEAMPLKEPWAVDEATQDGIESYITMCRCQEELRRIAKEARQMVCWAVDYQDKTNNLRQNTKSDILPIWATSKEVMMALTSTVARQSCRNWLRWNSNILVLLDETAAYNVCETFTDDELKAKWRSMFEFSLQEWEKMVQIETIIGIGRDEEDDEHPLNDDGEDYDLEDDFDDGNFNP
ncbi:hypothetical protein DFH28DRAFT_1084488 [Melampsora americana]|nr:hypothetical protein DFH28DRAFT_1084488 [Melampsora americana]